MPHPSDAVGEDGFLIDVDVQPILDAPTGKALLKDRSRDVDHFFTTGFLQKDKTYRNCRICS
jgi:hypothetical protein